ncbi:glutathione S-transferase [Shewanella waksmanii]|uniref:glutathione S-transferase n=1 Tax=Shewanella waksmanii TaxID=213783 RepID=UPI000491987E|nr:glutathione S-transferase [Shewanella waksmanii]
MSTQLNQSTQLPILYSFRRCPYAMRARLGLLLGQQSVQLREIILKHKPQPMLDASPKGTVPVLILANGQVIDESLDIMLWSLSQSDPNNLLLAGSAKQELAQALIATNDQQFKPWLDKYKYADRHPEHDEQYYRQQGETFIAQLEALLGKHDNLLSEHASIADFAIFPFIRQFAHVDRDWFFQANYPQVQRWLTGHINSEVFTQAMKKYLQWLDDPSPITFGAS